MKTTKQLVKFDFDVAVITALDAKYKDIQITDGKSYALVMAGLAEYRELRLAIDDKHKELKRDILEAGRGLDGDKNRLKALLEPGEDHLKEIRQVEDDRKAKIKEEKDRKERERIEAIQEKINGIRALGIVNNVASSHIKERWVMTTGVKITKQVYMEYTDDAIGAQKLAITALEKALTERLQLEKEDAERKAEAEHLEAQRKEQAEAQAKIDEAEKAAAKRQTENDARMAAEQAKIDEEKREIEENRKKFEETERKAKLKKEQEEWEKDEKARILLELEEKKAEAEQKQIEKEEAEAKEKVRQEALRPDKEKLMAYADALTAIPLPKLESKKANSIVVDAISEVGHIVKMIKQEAEKL